MSDQSHGHEHHDGPGESQDALRHQDDLEHHPSEHEDSEGSEHEVGHAHHDHERHLHEDKYAAGANEGE